MLSLDALGKELVVALDEHLAAQEQQRHAVSYLATGAAFEAWLAFEARLVVEGARERFGLGRSARLTDVERRAQPWLLNEYNKVDLFIGENETDCLATVEFKLAYNNKNWPEQAQGVRLDLFPVRPAKANLRPRIGRLAVLALVGKVFVEPPKSGQWEADLAWWEEKLLSDLGAPLRGVQIGRRHKLVSEWLVPSGGSFFQLRAFSAP